MRHISNPFRSRGLAPDGLAGAPLPSVDVAAVARLLSRCPVAAETPLVEAPALAASAGVARVALKDERGRMGLGSFKALGAAYVIADDAAHTESGRLDGVVYVTASAGNHGLSVAAGARVFGARAVVCIAEAVPEGFAERLAGEGAEIIRVGVDYAASMQAAAKIARERGARLLSDSSWPGYMAVPQRVMEGYLKMADEALDQVGTPPSHVFVQAGVGGMAGAVAALVRHRLGAGPRLIVVEPDAAPSLFESIRAGRPVTSEGPASCMGRLDCKTPSLIALAGLARDADGFVTITDAEAERALPALARCGLQTTPSGGAGVAALLAAGPCREALGLERSSHVLAIVSEGAVS